MVLRETAPICRGGSADDYLDYSVHAMDRVGSKTQTNAGSKDGCTRFMKSMIRHHRNDLISPA